MNVRQVSTPNEVDHLLDRLLDSDRRQPVCVVTTNSAAANPINITDLAEQVADLCEVWVLPTGALTFRLADGLPPELEVYGGAIRTFPAGTDWQRDGALAKRRFPGSEHGRSQLDRVVDDVFFMAQTSGAIGQAATTALPATATVRSFLADGSRAIVELPNGTIATIVQELTVAEVPLDQMLRLGDEVRGSYLPEHGRFVINLPKYDGNAFLALMPEGSVTLGLVGDVTRTEAIITLFPGLAAKLSKANMSPNPKDRVDLFFEHGDVVRVRLIRDAHNKLALRTIDIDDDEVPLAQLPIVPGGLPWLPEESTLFAVAEQLEVEPLESFLAKFDLRGDDELDEPVESEAVAGDRAESTQLATAPVPGPGVRPGVRSELAGGSTESVAAASASVASMSMKITALQAEITRLKQDNIRLKVDANRVERGLTDGQLTQIAQLHTERNHLKEQLAAEKAASRELRSKLKAAENRQVVGLDYRENRDRFAADAVGAADWVRWEVELAWVQHVPATERARKPLPDFAVGADFAQSLLELPAATINKSLRAVLDVLSGDQDRLARREVHPLRTGNGSSAPQRTRDDGATCWRGYVEANTASARRLHYWKLPDQRVELSRVVQHEDMDA